MLTFNALQLGYKKGKDLRVLTQPFSQTVPSGKYALMGLNGSGKSTLLKAIAGLIVPLSGQIQIAGKQLAELSVAERAQQVSMVFSQPPLTGNFSVREILYFGRTPYQSLWKEDAKEASLIEKYISFFRIEDFVDRPFLELSDGEKQRIMIARAFVQDTPVILLDEPTAHLDIVNKRKIYDLLEEIHHHEPSKTLIFSSHNPEMALTLASKVWLIHHLQFQEFTSEEFRKNSPFTPYL